MDCGHLSGDPLNCNIEDQVMHRLGILGGGESGVGAAMLGKKLGFQVLVSDNGTIDQRYKDVLIHHEIEWEELHHDEARLLAADLVVKSPGIPDRVPLVMKLKNEGVPVISEIEFASRYTEGFIIAITGSNGKTTTAMWTYHMLANAGLDVALCGNIGRSFAAELAEGDHDYFVLEVSSFQLDGIREFRPRIAVLTNITPDHLDRYEGQFELYVQSKFRIAMNQLESDAFIYDLDDPVIKDWLAHNSIQSQQLPFSLEEQPAEGATFKEDKIYIKIDNSKLIMPTANIALEGKHNIKNAMAASTVASLLQIRKHTIRESLENFQGAEHRLEPVLRINKVQYINDSKATNVNATYFALESMDAPTIWIVGGQDKGNDYTELFPFVNEKVKAIICLGVDNEKLMSAFGSMVDIIVETQFMSEAVKIAYKIAEAGDNVLLSPACASFDLFENYEDRGRQFKEAVRNL